MELRRLKEFLAVCECRSLSEAARQLGLAQSNLTKSIQALERSVGGSLFLRTKLGMKSTALGRALEARARVIIGEVNRTHRELGGLLEGQRGKVVMGTGISFAHAILPPVLHRFRECHPQIEVVVVQGAWPEVLPRVRTGDIDFAIFPTNALGQRDFASQVLLRGQDVVIVATAGNPIAAKRRVTLKEIWEGPWLLPTRPEPLRREYDAFFTKAGFPPLQPALEFTSYSFAKCILEKGNFLGFFTRMFIQDEIDRQIVEVVRVPGFKRKMTFHAIFRGDVQMPQAAQMLLDEIRQECVTYRRRR